MSSTDSYETKNFGAFSQPIVLPSHRLPNMQAQHSWCEVLRKPCSHCKHLPNFSFVYDCSDIEAVHLVECPVQFAKLVLEVFQSFGSADFNEKILIYRQTQTHFLRTLRKKKQAEEDLVKSKDIKWKIWHKCERFLATIWGQIISSKN